MSVQAIRDYVEMIRGIQDSPDAIQFLDSFLKKGEAFASVDWDSSQKLADIFGCKLQD